jgi:hypothetical protein
MGPTTRSGSPGGRSSRPERIALLHGESRDDPNAFELVLTFEPAGKQTRIVMRAVFPTKELRDEAVERYHAIESGEQTLRNLAAYVTEVARSGPRARGPKTAGETMTEQETGQEGTVR